MQSGQKIIEADKFRTQIRQEKVSLQFGKVKPNADPDSKEVKVQLLQTIEIEPADTFSLIMELVACGINYEKEYGKDIGFSAFWKRDEVE